MKKTITIDISVKIVFFAVDNDFEVSDSDFARMTNDEKLNFLGKLTSQEKKIYDIADPIGMNAFLLDYNGQILDGDNWWVGTIE